jgi:uncharacterized membrane protein YeiH
MESLIIKYWFELFGVAFFAISGALSATEKSNIDWFGVTFIGFITALGGGSLRDVLLGSYPIVWIKDVNFVYAILIGIVLARIFYKPLLRLRKTFFLFDTLGIALFTVVGTSKAISLGVGNINAATMGMFTAVFGGVLRDILTNEIPIIFRKEIYATACFVGALTYVGLHHLGIDAGLNLAISGGLIVLIRLLAVKFNWHLPNFKKE